MPRNRWPACAGISGRHQAEYAISAAARRSLQADHQGSIISVADGTENATAVNRYDEYGIQSATNAGRFGYTGQTWVSEVALNYYKARFYDPRLGRFLQTDPIGYKDDINLYVYVENDPMDGRDPTGLYVSGCAASDTKCNAAAASFEEQRQLNLQSKDVDVVASATSFGDPNQDNGVKVNFLDNKSMNAKYGNRTNGETKARLVGSKANITVDIRSSLRGTKMRGVSAHEGTHVGQRQALAASFDPATGKYSATLNRTKMATESQAYGVENRITHDFSGQREIDSHIKQGYQNLDQTLIPPEFAE